MLDKISTIFQLPSTSLFQSETLLWKTVGTAFRLLSRTKFKTRLILKGPLEMPMTKHLTLLRFLTRGRPYPTEGLSLSE